MRLISCSIYVSAIEWTQKEKEKMAKMEVNEKEYEIITLLGHGKSGYSYLVADGEQQYVLKQIHHEPCSYYEFGNKIEAEKGDYDRLRRAGIRMPQMYAVDEERERILKEYICGPTIYELVENDQMKDIYLHQVRKMSELAHIARLNIDYFPTNFVVRNENLYYIDYECNVYTEKWNFENWGILYWSKTPEFLVTANPVPQGTCNKNA